MASIDIFQDDAFSVTTLTAAINNPPEGQIIPPPPPVEFDEEGISTLAVFIERDGDSLTLVPATERGSSPSVTTGSKRDAIPFKALHLATRATVLADEIQNVRSFGSETELETVQSIVSKRLAKMRARIDNTILFHRFGALTGKIYDADGTTELLDLFERFGITQESMNFALATGTTNIKQKIRDAKRKVEDILGGHFFISGWRGVCGRAFYDAFVDHDNVKKAYELWNEGAFLRSANEKGFEFGEVVWKPYFGKVGNTLFIDPDEAYLVPDGVSDLFISRFAPADYIETVNTMGVPYYAKQRITEFEKGVELELQSNPLNISTRPRAILKLTKTA
jgi:hypothetical protein